MRLTGSRFVVGFTLAELTVAAGIGTAILAALTTASIALQRSFIAIEDYAKGQNDQMRISDYLALDLRRAFSVAITGSSAHPPVTVTLVIPNFYQPKEPNKPSVPWDPRITGVTGWPYKKHHHHKHQNVILNQVIDYGPSGGATTKTVTYVFDNGAQTLTRNVDGVASVIATEVKDFNVSISDLDETAQTQITFNPRFRTAASADAAAGTTYFQTTLTRNTR
ncbi:MAG TPA: hypothetical protein VJ719_11655 [Chthoniobacterales bacterium]|nr:hypothetical protein [Chthoniobacterales bacterium]